MTVDKLLNDPHLLRDIIATVLLCLAVILVRSALLRAIRHAPGVTEDTRLRWRVQLRYVGLILFALGVTAIWGSELRTLVFSIAAVSAALVLATKELILCFLGSVLRATSGAFSLGDRIQIGERCGDVIDTGLLATKMLEVGPTAERTGRCITVPNSLFLTDAILNETFSREHIMHTIRVSATRGDWQQAEQRLLQAANDICAPFAESTRSSFWAIAQAHSITPSIAASPESRSAGLLSADPQAAEPSVSVAPLGPDSVELRLQVPTPARNKGKTEQEILRRYLSLQPSR